MIIKCIFWKLSDILYHSIINNKNLSYYNENVLMYMNEYKIGPMSGYFYNYTDRGNMYQCIDENKAYTAKLLNNIKKIPVLSYFDNFEKYDNHEIEDYTQYFIKCKCDNVKEKILFGSRYSRAYGMKLNKIDRNMFEIIEFLRPSKLNDTNIDELINNLYDKKIIDNDYDDATIKKYCEQYYRLVREVKKIKEYMPVYI